MEPTKHQDLREKTYKLGDLSLGSIQERWLTCGKPGCKCAEGDKHRHGPYYYFTYTDPKTGKPAQISIRKRDVQELRRRIESYHGFRQELQELLVLEVEKRMSREVGGRR